MINVTIKQFETNAMTEIYNGGIELGILKAADDGTLSKKNKDRKAYLESLPKGEWIPLDENGNAISKAEYEKRFKEKLNQFKTI